MPQDPGIYLFLNNKGQILYCGKARNLRRRVSSYFLKGTQLGEKTKLLVSQVVRINIIIVESEIESLLLEATLIKKFDPKYNSRLTDGKAYPLIAITKKDPYPAVLVRRKEEQDGAVYFGPFPNSGDMRLVLRKIRRVFPYISVLHHAKRPCLYYHLGLCPCLPAFDTPENRRQYKETISHLVDFLNGKSKKVLRELERERDGLSKKELYEEAAKIQRQIDAITLITQPFHQPFEYEHNPNLRIDLRTREMDQLQLILEKNDVVIALPKRIECYDISHTSGKFTTASMVVFTNGEKDTSQYRKFKIRKIPDGIPNDFASMKEVLTRRLKHTEWDYPDLFIVDGGKGQVSSALDVLQELGVIIPVIGLAKREETIVTSELKEVSLPHDTPALQLLMRIRDEAHRFAITYQKLLRRKSFLP